MVYGFLCDKATETYAANQKPFVSKVTVYDELGAITKSAILKRASTITSSISPEKSEPRLKVFPNPGNGQFNFQYNRVYNRLVTLTIYNAEGKQIVSFTPEVSIDGSTLLKWNPKSHNCLEGMYLYRSIISTDGRSMRQEGKIVYQKD